MITVATFSVVAQQEPAANLIGLTLGVLALGIGLAALLLLCDIAFPTLVARARRNAQHMPWRSLLVGLINLSFFGLLAVALFSGDDGSRALGLIVATVLLSFVALGLAAVAQLLGERLRPGDPIQAMELMERGVTAAPGPASGWIGRHLAALDTGNRSPLRAIGLGERAQRSLQGSVPATALRSIADFHLGGDG
jgi:hypothetical protein